MVYNAYNDRYSNSRIKSRERWVQCVQIFIDYINPGLMYLFFEKYGDETQQKSIESFTGEAAEFAIKKIKSQTRWDKDVITDLVEYVSSMQIIAGYPRGFLEPQKIEEMFAHLQLDDDQKFINMTVELINNQDKILLEPLQSDIRKIIYKTVYYSHRFRYSPIDHVLCNYDDLFLSL